MGDGKSFRLEALLRGALDRVEHAQQTGGPLDTSNHFLAHCLAYQPPVVAELISTPLRDALLISGQMLEQLNEHINCVRDDCAACPPLDSDGRVRQELHAAKQSVGTVLRVRLHGPGRCQLASGLLSTRGEGDVLGRLLSSGVPPQCDVHIAHRVRQGQRFLVSGANGRKRECAAAEWQALWRDGGCSGLWVLGDLLPETLLPVLRLHVLLVVSGSDACACERAPEHAQPLREGISAAGGEWADGEPEDPMCRTRAISPHESPAERGNVT